jgi:tetratricopeptide (TPR) repeat protein
MSRTQLVVLLGLSVTLAAPADEPKPQWQRLLTGEDAKKLEELQRQILALNAEHRFLEEIRLREEKLALRTKVQGTDHWQTIDAKWELASAKQFAELPVETWAAWLTLRQSTELQSERLQREGKYAEALVLEEQGLALGRKVRGEAHPDTAARYGRVASLRSKLGKHGEAVRLAEKSLEIGLKTLGEDHPQTALAYNNLASHLQAAGEVAQAAPLYKKALDINRRVLGESDAATAQNYHNVGFNLDGQGKYAEALAFFQKALDIRRKV